MSARTKGAAQEPPSPVTLPGWQRGDRFVDIRGRTWKVTGFQKTIVGIRILAECVISSVECPTCIGLLASFDPRLAERCPCQEQ